MGVNRRNFLKKSGMSFLGTYTAANFSTIPHTVLGVNEKIVAGVIGTGSIGRYNIRSFLTQKEIEIAAVCDVFKPNIKKAMELTGDKVSTYKDFQRLIEHRDIDVIINATPDHWHAIPMIMACDAGKDVYVEKPI